VLDYFFAVNLTPLRSLIHLGLHRRTSTACGGNDAKGVE